MIGHAMGTNVLTASFVRLLSVVEFMMVMPSKKEHPSAQSGHRQGSPHSWSRVGVICKCFPDGHFMYLSHSLLV